MEYYEHTCGCGCGNKIEIKSWHKYQGIPKHFPYHQHKNRSEKTRKKMSESKKGQQPWNTGTKGVCKAWNKGKKLYHLRGKNACAFKHGKSMTQEYQNDLRREAQKNNDPRHVFSKLKSHLKRKCAVLDWDKEDFVEWYSSQSMTCTYCDRTVVRYSGKIGPQRDSISIDRKDYNGPYSRENCVISCMKCNIVKNDVLTYEQMKAVVGPLIRKNQEISACTKD